MNQGQAVSDVIEIASDLIPFMDDGKKDKYVTYRAVGFSKREAADMADVHPKSVMRWYVQDPAFKTLDNEGMQDLRTKVSSKYIDEQFTRNFFLTLQQDAKVLGKFFKGEQMDLTETNYLMKIRQHYTPQALAMVKQLSSGGTLEKPFDFSDYVLTLTRKRETVTETIEMKG